VVDVRSNHTFHNAATQAADGTTMVITSGQSALLVEISGTSASRTVLFKGLVSGSDTYRPILGFNVATGATATQTTGTDELWLFNVTGIASVMMDVSAVAGGNVTVRGTADDVNFSGLATWGTSFDGDGNLLVSLGTALSKAVDSIDVGKMSKGSVEIVHNAITGTATSAEIDARGFNAVLIEATIAVANKNWTFKVQGSMVSGGTFMDCYEQANTGVMTLMSHQTNANRIFLFRGIPDYIKIVATKDEDGATVTVKVQPLNV
jgi:hypothetical protein